MTPGSARRVPLLPKNIHLAISPHVQMMHDHRLARAIKSGSVRRLLRRCRVCRRVRNQTDGAIARGNREPLLKTRLLKTGAGLWVWWC